MNDWMNDWMNEWMNEQTNESMREGNKYTEYSKLLFRAQKQ